MIETNRRALITGLISLVAAPAIVRVGSIMPVKMMEPIFLEWDLGKREVTVIMIVSVRIEDGKGFFKARLERHSPFDLSAKSYSSRHLEISI